MSNPNYNRMHSEEASAKLSLGTRIASLTAVILPFLGVIAAAALLWGRGFSWVDLGLLTGLGVLTGLGITVGYHRLFTHRAFKTNRVVEFILSALGSMAVQGPVLKWAAMHRVHHQYSDQVDDLHSPHFDKHGALGLLHGIWHAHIGWLFESDPPQLDHYVQDIQQSRLLRVMSAAFPAWVLVSLLIPAVLGGLLAGTWTGVWCGLVWGGLVRIFVVHHGTWCVNSICHLWGSRSFQTGDQSRDNFVFGVLGLGEGWHHSHHAFPTSARHGLRWWQFDVSYWVIKALAILHLAWNVKVPSRRAQAALRISRGGAVKSDAASQHWLPRATARASAVMQGRVQAVQIPGNFALDSVRPRD
jgi:stearoyl-CoA desaturase (Delta-9 desaturase)